jgi:SAM-dependent methyltransferase
MASQPKEQLREFWDARSCGEVYASGEDARAYYETHRRQRYALESYLRPFARFHEFAGQDVLEIGVGMGADHAEIASAGPRSLCGIDLTPRAIAHTRERLGLLGLRSELRVADAENLPFATGSFDRIYSWGVIHHSPNTQAAVDEIHRVLREGGSARIMIYQRHSLVGFMLWLRYALLAGRPWSSLEEIYDRHLESPGTKAYTPAQGRALFAAFRDLSVRTQLSFGDLLEGQVGQRHGGALLRLARALWPRWALRRWGGRFGLYLLVEATK